MKIELYYLSKWDVVYQAETTLENIKNEELIFVQTKKYPKIVRSMDRYHTLVVIGEHEEVVDNERFSIYENILKITRKLKLKLYE